MKDKPLANVRVAILATNDFEQSEMTDPRQALLEAGAQTTLIAPKSGRLQAMKHDVKADYFDVDLVLERANPADFDAVMLPGGALNADALRMDQKAQEFVRQIDEAGETHRGHLSRVVASGLGGPDEGADTNQLSHHPR